MTNHRIAVAGTAVLLWGLAGGLALTGTPSPAQVGAPPATLDLAASKALYSEKCSACHDLPVPQEKGYTRQEWRRTVNLMLTKYNASESISRDQADQIIAYLGTFAPQSGPAAASGDPWATEAGDVWAVPASRTRGITFEAAGTMGWLREAMSGDGSGQAIWKVLPDSATADGHVAAVSNPTADAGRFALLIDPSSSTHDVDIRVRFRIVHGMASPAVGIAFGVQDPGHYDLLRYDGLRDQLWLMKMAEPQHSTVQKTDISTGADVSSALPPALASAKLPATPLSQAGEDGWHTLRLLVHGTQVRGWIDMSKRISLDAPDYNGGQVGLWSQGNTVAEFDDWITDSYDTTPATPAAAH